MRREIVGTAMAVVVACAGVAVQAGRARQETQSAQPGYERQLITVEGCLHRERVSERAALELETGADAGLISLLVNAEVRSRTDAVPGAPESGTVLGPAGIENERLGVPTGTTGAEPQPGSKDPDELPAPEGSPTPAADSYVVLGLEDDRLKLFTGQRVAMTGQFEPPAASVAPEGATADGPGKPGAQESGPEHSAGHPLGLPRFRATSIKPVPGVCPPRP